LNFNKRVQVPRARPGDSEVVTVTIDPRLAEAVGGLKGVALDRFRKVPFLAWRQRALQASGQWDISLNGIKMRAS